MPNPNFARLQADFCSPDAAVATAAADELGRSGSDEALDFLLVWLSSEQARLRDQAALGLRTSGSQRAVEPLLRAIQNPRNANHTGTLVYALEKLDCAQHLSALFDILFYGSYEAGLHAATILDEQEFEFSAEDLHAIERKWDDLQRHPTKCPNFAERRVLIQDYVAGFVSYLNPE